jgi:hypothetical protein
MVVPNLFRGGEIMCNLAEADFVGSVESLAVKILAGKNNISEDAAAGVLAFATAMQRGRRIDSIEKNDSGGYAIYWRY